MAICIISSILAFIAGFAFTLFCSLRCSDETWERFKKTVDKERAKMGADN